ncbi:MAG: hypothetical protein HDS37_05200 [Bacteroides sp.]|nr:hypothetical protein [Bacteroides sp.]
MKAASICENGCRFYESLDTMEALAFGFIRNEIDRMRHPRKEAGRKRRVAANALREKEHPSELHRATGNVHEDSDAKAYKAVHTDAPYDIESESESKSELDKKSSSGVRVCVNGGAITTISDKTEMNERIQPGICKHISHQPKSIYQSVVRTYRNRVVEV